MYLAGLAGPAPHVGFGQQRNGIFFSIFFFFFNFVTKRESWLDWMEGVILWLPFWLFGLSGYIFASMILSENGYRVRTIGGDEDDM